MLLCTWFPHRLESEDHARPWFCPKLFVFLLCTWFPHRLESEDHASPRFCPKLMFFSVLGFPIGLSPRTMQVLGFVQNFFEFRFSLSSGISRGAEQGLSSAMAISRRGPQSLGPHAEQA